MSSARRLLLAAAILVVPTASEAQATGLSVGEGARTNVRGFLNVDYLTGGENTGRRSSFALGQFDLYLTSRIGDRLSFLGETVFESDESGSSFVVDVERAMLRFELTDQLHFTVGKMHTPIGYWNNAYHHGNVIQPTISRPSLVQFEDDGGALPIHTLGVEFSGRDMGPAHLGFDVLLGNGLGNRVQPDDRNDARAVTLAVHSQVTPALRIGLSGYRDALAAGSPDHKGGVVDARVTQTIAGGFVAFFDELWEGVFEGHSVANRSTGTTTTSPGWFAYGGRRISERFVPYLVHDDLRLTDSDPYFLPSHTRREIVGMRYEQSAVAVYKLELRRVERTGLPRARELAAQLAVAF